MLAVYLCTLFLMPLGQRLMKDKVLDIRADIGAAVLSEGQFNTPAEGLTVFIRELSPDGRFHGILVHDGSDLKHPLTYLAKSGLLVQTPMGARLVMLDGTIQQSADEGAKLSVLKFQRYVFDLDQFASAQSQRPREVSERYLPELFWPDLKSDPGHRIARTYFAEAHNRLTAPLYCLAFAMIALAAVTRGRRTRGAYALRLTLASVAAGVVRILGYGALGLAARNPLLVVALYLVPLLAGGLAAIELMGFEPLTFRRNPGEPMPEPAP
jgi:lipopolysaccharide export system permease protein